VREKVLSAITWSAIIGLAIADAEGVAGARYVVAALVVLWLASVATPWIVRELPPPWRRRRQ
jgi:hypothetical protein